MSPPPGDPKESAESGQAQRKRRWRWMLWGAAAIVLLLPLFTGMNWGWGDFLVFGGMLVAACAAYELAARVTGSYAYRAAVGVAVVAAFILIWMNLAVGIIGSEDNPANLMFGAVLAVGLIGALIARFRAAGMARALTAMAIAQALVAVIALLVGLGYIFIITGIFVVLWLTSARLFQIAACKNSPWNT